MGNYNINGIYDNLINHIDEKKSYGDYLIEQKRRLTEMAISASDLKKALYDIIPQVINHVLLCLVFYPKTPDTLRHWTEDELYGFLHQVPLLKGKHRLPEYDWLMDKFNVWSDVFLDRVDNYISNLEIKENMTAPDYNKDLLLKYVIAYFEWLFSLLSTKGIVDKSDIFDKVSELINLYNKDR